MGSSFNFEVVPKAIRLAKDLRKFYEERRDELIKKHGEEEEEFERYSGDMASDNCDLVLRKDLVLELPKFKKDLTKKALDKDFEAQDSIMALLQLEEDAQKWGPSVAVRVNDQWVIAGFYSDWRT